MDVIRSSGLEGTQVAALLAELLGEIDYGVLPKEALRMPAGSGKLVGKIESRYTQMLAVASKKANLRANRASMEAAEAYDEGEITKLRDLEAQYEYLSSILRDVMWFEARAELGAFQVNGVQLCTGWEVREVEAKKNPFAELFDRNQ